MSQNQYVPIGSLVSRVTDMLPDLDVSQYTDKIYRWCFEAELRIGTMDGALPHRECVIDVVNYRGKLPPDFYKIDAVKTGQCELAVYSGQRFTYWNQDSPYLANRNLTGDVAGGAAVSLATPFYFGGVSYNISSRDYIDLSSPIPKCGIAYMALPIDGEGLPLVNELHELAVAAAIRWNIISSRYFSEKCSRQLYLDAKAEWEQEKTRAQYIDSEVGYDEAQYVGQIVSNHYFPSYGNSANLGW